MRRREEQFPLSEGLIEKFIQVNSKQWKRIKHTDQYIFVNLSMIRMQMGWIIPKLLYAKGMEQVTKARPVVFTWRENPLITRLIESFGMKHIALDTLNTSCYGAGVKSIIKTAVFMMSDGSGEGIKKINICGISAGKSLYEDMIRTSSLSTIRSARNKICIKKMIHLLWTIYSLDLLCKKHKPCLVVCDDIAYHEGLFLKLFHKYNASVYNTSSLDEREIIFENDGSIRTESMHNKYIYEQFLNQLDEKAVRWSENYLKERYEGKNGRSIDRGAFAGKKVHTREEVIKEQGLDPHKKNIVIMAHTFTDAVFNYGELYFRDYYDWTEQTLKLAAENDSVNWILKPHPTRSAYNESTDSIESMYEQYKKPHIFFLSDEVSAESIKNIADVIITIGGNAGAEFACEGIPSVIVGKPYYHGFGYTIEPGTREEYEECLKKIDQIEHLNEEQIITAKKVFCLRNNKDIQPNLPVYADEFADLVSMGYNQKMDAMGTRFFASNDGTQKYNDELTKKMTDYFDTHDMKECDYYKRGVMRGKEYQKE